MSDPANPHLDSKMPRILVVDDDPVNRQILASVFEGDHEVVLGESAEEALEICRTSPPALVLLDIIMPEVDGLEACRRLKADPTTRDLPVIFITAQGSPKEETDALATGAVDFIHKPINPAVVRARVKTHLTLKAQSDLLRSLAFQDGLTGLANRRRFDEYLETEWRRSRRSGAPLTLILADIDQFKHFNDHHGHLEGDACLQAVAQTLKRTLKRPHDLAARYGGEEFACILPETDAPGGMQVAEALLTAVRTLALPHPGTQPGIVTVSLGMATAVPSAEATPVDLISAADEKLYQAKQSGRNRAEG